MTLQQLEDQLIIATTEAAAVQGLVYPRCMELRRGARVLKPYHVASMRAHALLSQKSLDTRLVDSRADTEITTSPLLPRSRLHHS